ncbi:MarR family winged helix-turn-helix transcriptional regulator [Herbaspirillum sp. NPDC087042]|uniref:MarR family winged helix-turn-helix transcriptional regulator n=1 Tax=Herbaspirillum sp. NPDC087042 TaxID=3364004 RepID=UPI00382A3C3F
MSTGFTHDHTQAAEALRDFYLRSHRALDKLMSAEGSSLARTKILGHIERNSPVRSTDLAAAFGFAPRTITEAVDALERDGLVVRSSDSGDRRVKHIALTALGKEVLRSTEPLRNSFIEGLFSAITTEETQVLAQVLGKLNGRLAELEQVYSESAPTAASELTGKRGRKKASTG